MRFTMRRSSDRALVTRGTRFILALTAYRNGWRWARDNSAYGWHFTDRSGERFYCNPTLRRGA